MALASTCNKGLFIMAGPPSLPLVRWLAVLLQKRDVIGSESCHRTRNRRVPKTAGLRVCLPRSWQHHPARGWGRWPPVLWLQETLDVFILISSSLNIHAHDTESKKAARRWTSTSLSMGKISWKLRKNVFLVPGKRIALLISVMGVSRGFWHLERIWSYPSTA